MSHQGLRILHSLLRRHGRASCDLAFAPWPDMEQVMRAEGMPLFGLETRRPARHFDLVGFSLGYELAYTNLLTMIDLAGSPLLAAERGEGDPIFVAGGSCVMNPTVVAPFLDLVVLGDGEEVVLDFADIIADLKAEGADRARILERLRAVAGRLARGRRTPCPCPGPAGPQRLSAAGPPGAGDRAGARPPVPGGDARLRARLPLLPGRHDHPPGARTRSGPAGGSRPPRRRAGGLQRDLPAEPLDLRLQRSGRGGRRHPGRPGTGPHQPGAAQPAPGFGGRGPVRAHRPRAALQLHLRARGRQPAPARRHQQEHQRRGRGRHRRPGPALGRQVHQALLHDRPADRDRRGPGRAGGPGGQGGGAGAAGRQPGPCLDLAVLAQEPHALPVGRTDPAGRDRAAQQLRGPAPAPLQRQGQPARRGDLGARGHAGPGRPRRRPGGAGGLARGRPLRRLERALRFRPLGAGLRRRGHRAAALPRSPRSRRRRCPGTRSTAASTGSSWPRTGTGPSGPVRCTTAGSRTRATSAAPATGTSSTSSPSWRSWHPPAG